MENRIIFKLEFHNLIFKENAITYHETDQKGWFLMKEGCLVLCSADEVTWRNVVKIEVTSTK